MQIDIYCDDERWEGIFSDLKALTYAAVHAARTEYRGREFAELSVGLINDARMRALNGQFRGKDKATNVLSFPADAPMLGDIVLSYETLITEASARAIPAFHHLAHLLVHGYLHLQGLDHQNDKAAANMEAIEIAALRSLLINNPYDMDRPS